MRVLHSLFTGPLRPSLFHISSGETAGLNIPFLLCWREVPWVVEAEAIVPTRGASLPQPNTCSEAGSAAVRARHRSRLAAPRAPCDSSSCTQNEQAQPLQEVPHPYPVHPANSPSSTVGPTWAPMMLPASCTASQNALGLQGN